MQKKTIHIAVFGGSNSAKVPGYLDTVAEILERDFDLKFVNAAVGGNTSLFGLLSAKFGDAIETSDVVLIEYAINDYSLCRPETWPFYCGTVEGLVREILNRNNHAHIFLIQLGRRAQDFAAYSENMLEFSLTLSAHYGVHTVAVDSHLRQTLDADAFKKAYSDDLHYRLTTSTGIVGPYVAQAITAVLQSPTTPRFDAPPVSADTFEGSVALRAADLIPLPTITFDNSRYSERAIEIRAGESLKVSVPGRLLLAGFVACANSCRVTVTENSGKTMTFESARPEKEGDDFPFLIRSVPFSRRDWATIEKGKWNELTISALPRDGSVTVKSDVPLKPARSAGPAFYLSSFLVY
jgi:hypothetical protein